MNTIVSRHPSTTYPTLGRVNTAMFFFFFCPFDNTFTRPHAVRAKKRGKNREGREVRFRPMTGIAIVTLSLLPHRPVDSAARHVSAAGRQQQRSACVSHGQKAVGVTNCGETAVNVFAAINRLSFNTH